MTTSNPIASACSIAAIARLNGGLESNKRQSVGRSVILKKSHTKELGQPRSQMSAACTWIPRARIARTRLPRPQNGSHTLVTRASNGSCSNSGFNTRGGVSNRSSPRIERGRPKEGRRCLEFPGVFETIVMTQLTRRGRHALALLREGLSRGRSKSARPREFRTADHLEFEILKLSVGVTHLGPANDLAAGSGFELGAPLVRHHSYETIEAERSQRRSKFGVGVVYGGD